MTSPTIRGNPACSLRVRWHVKIYGEVQEILARDLPYINLWYLDNVIVHSRRVQNLKVSPSGNYDFLKTAELAR